MPTPFQFDYYRSNAPRDIAAIMERDGAQQAAAVRASGENRARAVANIGQDVAGTIGGILQERKDKPIRDLQIQNLQNQAREGSQRVEMNDAAIATSKRETAARAFFNAALADSQTIDAHGLPAYDHAKVLARLKTSPFPELAQQYADKIQAAEKAGADLAHVNAETARANAEAAKPIEHDPTKDLLDPNTHAVITPGTGPKKSYEQKQVTLDGKPNQLVNYDPQTGQSFIPGTADPIDAKRIAGNPAASVQVHNMIGGQSWPGDFSATGEDFIKSIPKQWQATVRKIAHYDEDPTKVASMRGGNREMLTAWVNQVNPAYDAGLFTNRAPTRKAFTTGTQGQQITAMNTAVEHLDQLQAAADALANGTFKPGNRAYNYLRDTFGSAMPSNYDTIKNMVDKEVEAVANKGVPTVAGTAAQQALAGTAASPQAIKGYIDTLIPLMGSKLNALHYQYQQAMGVDDPWKPLTPQAEAILQKRGITPGARPEPAQTAGAVTISTPSGKAYPFPTQAAADRFVADAKAKGLWK